MLFEYEGEILSGAEALKRAGLTPVSLEAKEGLALINGTQAMTGVGVVTYFAKWDLKRRQMLIQIGRAHV